MVYSFFGAIVTSFSLTITRDKDASFNCPAKIEILSIAFPASMLSSARAIARFFTVLSTSAKSLF